MKRLLLSVCMLFSTAALFAQMAPPPPPPVTSPSTMNYKKRTTLVVNFLTNDYRGGNNNLRNESLKDVTKNFSSFSDMDFGLGIQLLHGLTNHIDLSGRLDGSFTQGPFPTRPRSNNDGGFLMEGDAGFNIKLLSDRYFLVPYLHAGIGGSLYNGAYFAVYTPLGAGLQFNLGKGDAFIFTNAQYRLELTDKTDHLNFNLGFGGALSSRKAPDMMPPPPPPAPIDTDGDGIPDDMDSCKTVPGVAKYNGCPVPDTDKDGINDDNDKCPTQPGLAKYQGCPIPDTDGDGINDEVDKCPTQPGTAKYNGCPIPDTDGDGVNDEIDKCPTVAGPARNNGCPEKAQVMQARVDTIARQIYFATGKAVLLGRSFKILTNLATLLKQNTDLGMDIEGHTDNVGTDANNLKLSQARADAVLKYLKSKGVPTSRISAKGYGESLPIADNETVEGRALNRRVELKLRMMQ